jgi:hypothetical protein
MPFWRRGKEEEPAHERLARDAGIDLGARGDADRHGPLEPVERIPLLAAFREAGIHGLHRQRQWDAVATAEAPELRGDEVEFVTLPDGTVLIEDDVPEGSLSPLADALEQELSPPYRAHALRRDGDVWAVAANAIDVVAVPEEVKGDTVSLAVQGEERTLLVDERPAWGDVPTLESFAAQRHRDFALHAERLDGDLWSVKVNPL